MILKAKVVHMLTVLFLLQGTGVKSTTMTQHVNFLHMLNLLLCRVEGGKFQNGSRCQCSSHVQHIGLV